MRKMKKTTPKQFEIIVSYLKHHENLFVGCSNNTQIKARRKELWIQLADVLNHHGPPVRKCNEWKIIWSDYKYNLKRKLAADMKLKRKHYKKSLPFNKTERTVLAMLGLIDEEADYNKHEDALDVEESMPKDVPHPMEHLLSENEAAGSEVEIVEEIMDNKESIVLCNDDFTKEEPVIQSAEPLSMSDEELIEGPKSDVNVPPTLSSALLTMERTQQAILKELKVSNRQKKQLLSIKERLLLLEQEKFDEKKLQNYEENTRAYTMIELRKKELELYELKLKGLCTQCVEVKPETNS